MTQPNPTDDLEAVVYRACSDYHAAFYGPVSTRPSRRDQAVKDGTASILAALRPAGVGEAVAFQARVLPWLMECFGAEIAADREERCDRFIEEALEQVQSLGWPKERALALVDYVYGRPAGDPHQEAGGVMVTFAALCQAVGLDMAKAGDDELARIMQPEIVAKIRAKQAAKPTGSALPIAAPPHPDDALMERVRTVLEPLVGMHDQYQGSGLSQRDAHTAFVGWQAKHDQWNAARALLSDLKAEAGT